MATIISPIVSRIPNNVLLVAPMLLPAWAATQANSHIQHVFLIIGLIGVAGCLITNFLIPIVAKYTVKNFYGRDINKKGTPAGEVKIPESLGIACGTVYLACGVIGQFWYSHDPNKLVEYNAAFYSICFMILLGFVDDALDIPWRYKLILPAVASLPVLIAYSGDTSVMIPSFLSGTIGIPRIIDLGGFYLVYMFLLLIFCTNAINIHAGINGLEAGQSFIIAIFIVTHNIIEAGQDDIGRAQHIFSMFLIVPFIATTIGLLLHNWYPSSVFVGDTFTMFSGMTLAVSGVLGHFSKTLLLFFIPQILNFLYSVPQLFRIFGFECPRHRLPRYNTETRKLEGIPSHLNLVNLFLCVLGPMSERDLCIVLLAFQIVCGAFAMWIRYYLPQFMF